MQHNEKSYSGRTKQAKGPPVVGHVWSKPNIWNTVLDQKNKENTKINLKKYFQLFLPEECSNFFQIWREPSHQCPHQSCKCFVVLVRGLDGCRIHDLEDGLVVLVNHLLVVRRRLDSRGIPGVTSLLVSIWTNNCYTDCTQKAIPFYIVKLLFLFVKRSSFFL